MANKKYSPDYNDAHDDIIKDQYHESIGEIDEHNPKYSNKINKRIESNKAEQNQIKNGKFNILISKL